MKSYLLIIAVILFTTAFSQKEFKTFDNGLMYSPETMGQLTNIVDSLNLKYKVCDKTRNFYSKYQGFATKVQLQEKDAKAATKDMKNGISLTEFKQKYKSAKVDSNLLVVRFDYENYKNEKVIEFGEISPNGYGTGLDFKKELDYYSDPNKRGWIFQFHEKSTYGKAFAQAFYFEKPLERTILPEKYNHMIVYSDCLIDTTTTKLKKDMVDDTYGLPKNWRSLDKSKQEKILDELRGTKVVGMCSMDDSPRNHAKDIALISAETAKWEVFLKAHLDIMNDRFERVTDGSYAYGRRLTYIKELEELNINVIDLLLGISLRIDNAAENHYYGSINRLGRAIAETKNRALFEKEMIEGVSNTNLDMYNRILFFFLYDNYVYHLKDEVTKKASQDSLNEVTETLPASFTKKIKRD